MTDKDNVKKQYENYKKQLDKINDRYSETYVKPETDMPDSLGLKTVDYKMPSEDELRKKAETALEADRQSAISKIGKETEEKIKKQSALKDQAFAEAAKRLLDIDSEREQAVREVKNDALARNIARSSIASEGVRETEERAAALRRDAQAERDGTAEAIDREIEALKKQASDSLSQTEKNFLSRLEAETEKLREKALEEKTEAEKAAEAKRLAEEKAERERKAAEEAARKRVSGAFGKGAQMTGNKGTAASGTGTEGSKEGNSSTGAKTGTGGYGTFDLGGRSLGTGSLPKPAYNVQEEGRVVVNITVNPAGQVVATSINPQTNTVNSVLRKAAEDAARKARFNTVDGVTNQTGTITYYFNLR